MPFGRGQIVVSCVAGTPLDQVMDLVAPAVACRLIPLPMISRRQGPLVLYPALPAVRELFEGQGDLIEVLDEEAFGAFAVGSAAMSSFFALQAVMADWIALHGVSPSAAASYVRSLHRALAETSLQTNLAWPALVGEHETAGGLNERVRLHLKQKGWFDAIESAFDSIASLRRSDLKTHDEG